MINIVEGCMEWVCWRGLSYRFFSTFSRYSKLMQNLFANKRFTRSWFMHESLVQKNYVPACIATTSCSVIKTTCVSSRSLHVGMPLATDRGHFPFSNDAGEIAGMRRVFRWLTLPQTASTPYQPLPQIFFKPVNGSIPGSQYLYYWKRSRSIQDPWVAVPKACRFKQMPVKS